jgi:hypothetical protein
MITIINYLCKLDFKIIIGIVINLEINLSYFSL